MKKYFAIFLFALVALGFVRSSGLCAGFRNRPRCLKDAQGNPVVDGIVVWANQDNGQKYAAQN